MLTRFIQLGVVALAAVLSAADMHAQKAQPVKPGQRVDAAPALPPPRGESLDSIVAIVNGEVILESDIEEEMHWYKLQPYRTTMTGTPREQALNRLIDRALILQQEQGYVQTPVKPEEIDAEVKDMRENLPACERYRCNTDEGWKHFLADEGFTAEELRARVKSRIEVLRFIQQRFRNGIRISDAQIADFYKNTMLPQYEKEHATPPPLDSVSDRIEQVLLQQQVSSLLDAWLKALRDEGSVRVLKHGEEAP